MREKTLYNILPRLMEHGTDYGRSDILEKVVTFIQNGECIIFCFAVIAQMKIHKECMQRKFTLSFRILDSKQFR